MAEENKEEILANFQGITGIEDVGEAFSHLEETDWDLMTAIQRVMPQDDHPALSQLPQQQQQQASLNSTAGSSTSTATAAATTNNTTTTTSNNSNAPSTAATNSTPMALNNFSSTSSGPLATGPGCSNAIAATAGCSNAAAAAATSNHNRWNFTNSGAASLEESSFVPVASIYADADIIDLTSDIDLDPSRHQNDLKVYKFNIQFEQQMFPVQVPQHATIGDLKLKIVDATNVPMCRQSLRGWPQEKQHEAYFATTKLSGLGLSAQNELILVDLTQDGFMDFETDEVPSSRRERTFCLNITEQPSGRPIQLNFPGQTTIQKVKSDVFDISDIPVRHQEWSGWPPGCNNNLTLEESGIGANHNFVLMNAASKMRHSAKANASPRSANVTALDTDSSADEFEDASDFNACEEFFTDTPQMQPQNRHLIPNHTDNESTGSREFVQNYIRKFGEPHPAFFTGSLEDALRTACHRPARERKLLAIYLHHGESILTNVFCDHKLKHESIMQTLAQNFVLYGWDLTFESNKDLFMSSVTGCIGTAASLTVRNVPIDKLPSLLIIGKSRLSGRTSCEVLSVIHGDVGLDDLLSRLLESVELYSEHLQVEIREEEERAARDQVKAEQDMAYEDTLRADQAKEAAKRQKEAAIVAERQRLASEQAEEEARRESIRHFAEQSLPPEPSDAASEHVTKIRIRKPTGDFLERRFNADDTLKDLLNFVTSQGFLIDEFKIISSWPRRDLTAIDTAATLQALKLYPQETVILEER